MCEIVAREIRAGDEHQVELRMRQNYDVHFAPYQLSCSTALLSLIAFLWLQPGPFIRQTAKYFDAREGRGAEFHANWPWKACATRIRPPCA